MPLEQGMLYIPVPSSHQDYWLGQRGVSVQLHGWGWVLSQGSLYLQPQASAPQTWRMLHSKVMADQLQTPRSSATRRSLLSFLAQRKLSPCPASVQVGIGRSSHTTMWPSLCLYVQEKWQCRRMYPDNTKIFIRLHVFSSFHIQKCFTLYECVTWNWSTFDIYQNIIGCTRMTVCESICSFFQVQFTQKNVSFNVIICNFFSLHCYVFMVNEWGKMI